MRPLSINGEKLAHFVKQRLNSDGGYSFSYPLFGVEFPSSISETYYALAILNMLQEEPSNKHETLKYLSKIQRPDGRYDSPTVAFYAVKCILLLGEKPKNLGFANSLNAILKASRLFSEQYGGQFFSADYDVSESPFKLLYYSAKILRLMGLPITEDLSWLSPGNPDGGFGVGRSDVASTYHAIATLYYSDYDVKNLKNSPNFLESCRNESGGYSSVFGSFPPYIETTYFAIAALQLLGLKAPKPEKHADFIHKLQNGDGGFRRSPYVGISTLCNSYFALKTLTILAGDKLD